MADQTPRGTIPPHNELAERSVLGALLQDSARIPDAVELLRPEDFFDRRHRLVFETMLLLAERNVPVDLLSVAEALKSQKRLADVGGNAHLAELTDMVNSAAHLLHHADLVVQTALLRRLIAEATDVITAAHATNPDRESVSQLLDESEHRLFQVTQGRDRGGVVHVSDALTEAFKRIDASRHRGDLTGLSSGYYELDDMLGGFNPGELTIIAARPSMGKTAFALNLIQNAASHRPAHFDHDPVILFFSLEMGRLSIVQRMLCADARVDAHKLRTGKIDPASFADLGESAGRLRDMRIYVDDTPGLSVMAIRSRARRVKHNHGLDLIVLDYLQLMSARAENRQQEISLISRSLKELARELEVPLIALSQLSRNVESRDKKRPQLSDLRESGSIEQDADVVLMLYREEYYNQTDENRGVAEIICAKQRNGPTGDVRLHFQGNIMRFENPAPSIAETIQI
ncbi:MAG: replicative DNA helicase [Planctomycetota bacterium]